MIFVDETQTAVFYFIIPTYNERENIEALVDEILKCFPESRILVVDDNSPDGTAAIVSELNKKNPRIQLMLRLQNGETPTEHRGIGHATIAGLKQVLSSEAEWLITIDGDGSHNPADLERVVESLQSTDAKLWVGSRYCAGGQIEQWPWHRRISSKLLNTCAKLFLRVPVSDYSSAFRAYHRSVLCEFDFASIRSGGYAYLEEILFELHRSGITIAEFPIRFTDRELGESKASPGQVMAGIRDLLRLFITRR